MLIIWCAICFKLFNLPICILVRSQFCIAVCAGLVNQIFIMFKSEPNIIIIGRIWSFLNCSWYDLLTPTRSLSEEKGERRNSKWCAYFSGNLCYLLYHVHMIAKNTRYFTTLHLLTAVYKFDNFRILKFIVALQQCMWK